MPFEFSQPNEESQMKKNKVFWPGKEKKMKRKRQQEEWQQKI